ncbi:GNAT family N-acetyltransferase [Lapidilactobacillus luobeiensis]|uniref:GNAT family N-acetyltransferase n=1 Tax=Lapidilactobacillus luobeiensis TaxID=2950371 RepID=UPI0035A2233D
MTALVAVTAADQVVGFAAMTITGYLDYLYVATKFQRQGIAAALLDILERRIPVTRWTTAASITARPFFEAHGYRSVRRNQVQRHSENLINFTLIKQNKLIDNLTKYDLDETT